MSNIDISTSRNYLYTLLAGFVLLFAVSCEDKNDDDEGHTDADGFVLETEDGVEAYKELKGTKTGSIELGVGDTLHFMVHFLDENGKEIEHEEEGHDDEEEGHDDEEDAADREAKSLLLLAHERQRVRVRQEALGEVERGVDGGPERTDDGVSEQDAEERV